MNGGCVIRGGFLMAKPAPLPLNTVPDPYGLRCFACNAYIDGWRPGYPRFCNACQDGAADD